MPTVASTLRSTARRVPDTVALVFGAQRYTYGELDAQVVLPGFDPGKVLDVLESERITRFFGVPTMFQFLLRQPDATRRDLSAWRTGLFGAAPMPASAVEQLVTAWPQVNFMQLCGLTEAGPGGIYADVEQVKARPDASGRQALLFTEARVVDSSGSDVAVVGRPHPDYGESIVAVVTPREGATVTLADVKAFCANKIARYKIPHDLVVGAIPRTPSGKILKHQLRDRVREAHAVTP